jgi:tetratricopeptide (TPR) repeat protein
LGDLDGAATAYKSGLVADPAALENRIGLATLALKRRAPEEALREYDRVLAARPGFGDGYLGRAWALIALGRLRDAAESLDEARRHGADPRAIDRQAELLASLTAKARAPSESSRESKEKRTNP